MILPQAFFEPKGTSFSTFNRLSVLSELGYKVDLLTYPVGKDLSLKNINIFRIPNILFRKRVRIGPSWIKLIFDLVLIIYAIKMLIIRKYDLIYSHEEAGFFSTFFAKVFGKYHIYDMHSSLPQQLINFHFTKSKFVIGIFNFLEKMTLNNTDAVIAICPALYEGVQKVNPEANVYLIENVLESKLDDNNFVCNITKLRHFYHMENKKVILYAGTFEKYQGLELLIEGAVEIIDRFKDVHFLLVGGNQEQVTKYRNLVEQKNLEKFFTFTGSVHQNMVDCFYQLADILVSPRLEGTNTPLKIYAYLRSGKPIVATRHITHTQVLNDDVAILTGISSHAFAKGILQALEDKNLGERLSQNAMLLAEEKYSRHHYVEQIKRLMNSLLKYEIERPV